MVPPVPHRSLEYQKMKALLRIILFSVLGIFAALIAAASRYYIVLEYFYSSQRMGNIAWLGIIELLVHFFGLIIGQPNLAYTLEGNEIASWLLIVFNPITGGI